MNAAVVQPNDAEQAARLVDLLDAMQRELSEEYDEVPTTRLLPRRARGARTTVTGGRA